MMSMENICLGCMGPKGNEKICAQCGWEEGMQPESPLHLKPGTVLSGKYLLGRVLGHGGFGITYLACDLNLGTKLAVKEYFPQGMATRNAGDATISVYSGNTKEHFEYGLEKFIEEARTLAKFDDIAEIVTIKDFFKENGTAYLVMSYIEGVTMKEYLDQNGGRLPLDAVLNVMLPVMKALEHVHKAGILHRDISPDNIYITRNFNVKVLDFGAARFAMGEHSKSLSVLLKPGYAPEEQYRTRGKQGPWTDVYAVAATMYKALTGETPPEALDRLEEDTLQPPSQFGVELPGYIWEAMKKALAVKGSDRYQDIEKFCSDIESGSSAAPKPDVPAKVEPAPAVVPAPDSPEAEIASKPASAKPYAALLVVVSIGIVLIVAFLVSRGLQKPATTTDLSPEVTNTPKVTVSPLPTGSSALPSPSTSPGEASGSPMQAATPAPGSGSGSESGGKSYEPLSSVSLTVDKSSPQKANTEIGFTAFEVGGSNNKSYRFYARYRTRGGWEQINSSTYSNYCAWHPSTAGLYAIKVTVRDNDANTEVSSEVNFEITDDGIYENTNRDVYEDTNNDSGYDPNRDIYQ